MPVRRHERPLIVPIFIPNQGCPYRCIFCQQEKITGHGDRCAEGLNIKQTLDKAIESRRYKTSKEREVAFYGGTFTNLPASKMLELLKTVKPYIDQKLFTSIRISTRPDSVEEDRLEAFLRLLLLLEHPLDDVEAHAERQEPAQGVPPQGQWPETEDDGIDIPRDLCQNG